MIRSSSGLKGMLHEHLGHPDSGAHCRGGRSCPPQDIHPEKAELRGFLRMLFRLSGVFPERGFPFRFPAEMTEPGLCRTAAEPWPA